MRREPRLLGHDPTGVSVRPVRPWEGNDFDVAEELRRSMAPNPYLHVMVQSGYFDGALTHLATRAWLDPALADGFSVAAGGRLVVAIEPTLAPSGSPFAQTANAP